MSNVERKKRSFTEDTSCDVCRKTEEDLNHIFRFCSWARPIWKTFIPESQRRYLDTLNFTEWLSLNLEGKVIPSRKKCWKTMFAIIVWGIWKWRNEAIFNNKEPNIEHKIWTLERQEDEIQKVFKRSRALLSNSGKSSERNCWKPPLMGWVTINTDACFKTHNELAGCGGVLRDDNGDWVTGFSCTVRVENSAEVECWALLKALQWAWTMGYKSVCFQTDAKNIVEWIENPVELCGPIRSAIEACKDWFKKDWRTNLLYIPREHNKVADSIATIARNKRCEWVEFKEPPEECRRFLARGQDEHQERLTCQGSPLPLTQKKKNT